jgi:hypothetical protein
MMRLAAAILVAVLTLAAHADAPKFKIERGAACVAPTAEMRRDHMDMLLQQRDRTMRQGLREPRFSLKNCVDCHASRATGSVLGKEGFCSSCHEYTAVKMDCFECHTPLRQKRTAARP